MVFPASSRLQSGVIVVPQLKHAMANELVSPLSSPLPSATVALPRAEAETTVALAPSPAPAPAPASSFLTCMDFCPPPEAAWLLAFVRSSCGAFSNVFFATTLLLNAGHPLHAAAPPVPLHRPSPLQLPSSSLATTIVFGGRFKFTGLWELLDLKYKPQALQMRVPSGALLHKGVFVVPQFEHCWPSSGAVDDSCGDVWVECCCC